MKMGEHCLGKAVILVTFITVDLEQLLLSWQFLPAFLLNPATSLLPAQPHVSCCCCLTAAFGRKPPLNFLDSGFGSPGAFLS